MGAGLISSATKVSHSMATVMRKLPLRLFQASVSDHSQRLPFIPSCSSTPRSACAHWTLRRVCCAQNQFPSSYRVPSRSSGRFLLSSMFWDTRRRRLSGYSFKTRHRFRLWPSPQSFPGAAILVSSSTGTTMAGQFFRAPAAPVTLLCESPSFMSVCLAASAAPT